MRVSPVPTTPRCPLRPRRDDDLPAFAALDAGAEAMRHFPATPGAAESDALAVRIRAGLAARGFGFRAMEVPGVLAFAGFVGLSVPRFEAAFTRCVEIGWRLARAAWGRGLAGDAASAVPGHAFGPLGLDEVVAFTAAGIRRSRAAMERIGMRHDAAGTFGPPLFAPGHCLRTHVLCRASAAPGR